MDSVSYTSAVEAGLESGDEVVAIDDLRDADYPRYRDYLQKHKNDKVLLTVRRDGALIDSLALPVDAEGRIGVTVTNPYSLRTQYYTFWESIPAGIHKAGKTISSYWDQLKLIVQPKTKMYEELGGFVAIGSIFPGSWDWHDFWLKTAFLSIILAVMNLLPIPGLDGGHALFTLWEIITRRKPSEKFLEVAQYVGLMIILALLVYAVAVVSVPLMLDRDADVAVGAVLEADGRRQAGGDLAVCLRFGRARTDGRPGNQIAEVLRRNRVERFGAGWQAEGHVRAICASLPLERVKVFSRNPDKLQAFCQRLSEQTGVAVVPAVSAEDTVRGSDIVSTITTASSPLFDAAWLSPGTHINAAGSNSLIRREVGEDVLKVSRPIVVDSVETALKEAGDLLPVMEKGRLSERQLVELGDIILGRHPGRSKPEDITLFESQGMAIQDISVAVRLEALARENGLGVELPYGA